MSNLNPYLLGNPYEGYDPEKDAASRAAELPTTPYSPSSYNPYNYMAKVAGPGYDFNKLKEKIWEWQWPVSMPRKWTYTVTDYEVYGIPISGDEEADMAAMEEWVTTTRTLAQLVELYDEGKEFSFVDYSHIDKAFDIISEYTSFIAYQLNNSLHLQTYNVSSNKSLQQVLNDVVKLQNLANRLFPAMVALNEDAPAEVTGLFGFINSHTVDLAKFDFDPLSKYGLSKEIIRHKDNVDPATGLYKAVDIESKFDPHTFDVLRKAM